MKNTIKQFMIASILFPIIAFAQFGGGSGTVTPLPVRTFTGLTDTPNSYSGEGGKTVKVKADESGLEFGTGGSGSSTPPGGNQYDLQFNNPLGNFDGSDLFTYDGTTVKLTNNSSNVSFQAISHQDENVFQIFNRYITLDGYSGGHPAFEITAHNNPTALELTGYFDSHSPSTGNDLQARFSNDTNDQPAGFRLSNGGWDIGFRTIPNVAWFDISDSGGNSQHQWVGTNYFLDPAGKLGFSANSLSNSVAPNYGVSYIYAQDSQTLGIAGSLQQGQNAFAIGNFSFASGNGVQATGDYAHAEGDTSTASGTASHAEGQSEADGNFSHSEGLSFSAGLGSHSEGLSQALIDWAHSEGSNTIASGISSHAEGNSTQALGDYAHSEGDVSYANGIGSHAEGNSTADGIYSHSEGNGTQATGDASHAEGINSIATALYSHVEGSSNETTNQSAHAEGELTRANGYASHAEGYVTKTYGVGSHAEGDTTIARGDASHAEGFQNISSGIYSHSEGYSNFASGNFSHAEGYQDQANYDSTHAEGNQTMANGQYSHAQGSGSQANGYASQAEGNFTVTGQRPIPFSVSGTTVIVSGDKVTYLSFGGAILFYNLAGGTNNTLFAAVRNPSDIAYDVDTNTTTFTIDSSLDDRENGSLVTDVNGTNYAQHAEGESSWAMGSISHAEGYYTKALAYSSHAEGNITEARSDFSHAEGYNTIAGIDGSDLAAHAEGFSTQAIGDGSHAEGLNTIASGDYSHAEGISSEASGDITHAEGGTTLAFADFSHSEGQLTKALGENSHAEGYNTITSGLSSHAEGDSTQASGTQSHAEGYQTFALSDYSHVEGNGSYTDFTSTGAHAEGYNSYALGEYSHAEGTGYTMGAGSHAEGLQDYITSAYNWAVGFNSHAEGMGVFASGDASHAEGYHTTTGVTNAGNKYQNNTVSGTTLTMNSSYGDSTGDIPDGSYISIFFISADNIIYYQTEVRTTSGIHFDGSNTIFEINTTLDHDGSARVDFVVGAPIGAHAEGGETFAMANYSHAENYQSIASGHASHAEGNFGVASGAGSHAEGSNTLASGDYSHAQGENTIASGLTSFAAGKGSSVSHDYSTVFSDEYGISSTANDQFTASYSGGIRLFGEVDVGTNLIHNVVNPVDPQDAATKAYVDAAMSSTSLDFWTQSGTVLYPTDTGINTLTFTSDLNLDIATTSHLKIISGSDTNFDYYAEYGLIYLSNQVNSGGGIFSPDQTATDTDAQSITLSGGVGNGTGDGGSAFVQGGQGGSTGNGGLIDIIAGDDANNNGNQALIELRGQEYLGSGDTNGGDIFIKPGLAGGVGTDGQIHFQNPNNGNDAVLNVNLTSTRIFSFLDEGGSFGTIVATPASSTTPCVAGVNSYDSSYFYVCVATNTWMRTALSTW